MVDRDHTFSIPSGMALQQQQPTDAISTVRLLNNAELNTPAGAVQVATALEFIATGWDARTVEDYFEASPHGKWPIPCFVVVRAANERASLRTLTCRITF